MVFMKANSEAVKPCQTIIIAISYLIVGEPMSAIKRKQHKQAENKINILANRKQLANRKPLNQTSKLKYQKTHPKSNKVASHECQSFPVFVPQHQWHMF